MCDPSDKKASKNRTTESEPSKKHRTLTQSLTSTANSYTSQLIEFVKTFWTDKQVLSNDRQTRFKGLISKTEEKIREVYEKMIREAKLLQENELRISKYYSKEELAKAEIKLKEYSAKIQEILGELIKRLQIIKNQLQTTIMTNKEIQSSITYFEEKIDQLKKLTEEMIKNIQKTIKDPELNKKFVSIIEDHWKKVQNATDTLFTAIKDRAYADGEHKCAKLELKTGESLKLLATSSIVRVTTYIRGFLSGKSDSNVVLVSKDLKNLLTVTELRVKELYDGILKIVKDIQDNELQTCQNYSKEELAKVRSNLQEYSVKIRKLSDEMVKRLNSLTSELQRRVTLKDFQGLVLYFEAKMIETKKLSEDLIKNLQEIMKDPNLAKKLRAITETNSRKIKTAFDDLYAAIKKNIAKVRRYKSLSETKTQFLKMSTFSKIRPLNDSLQALPSNDNEATAVYKGNSTVFLNKDKLPILNLSKHFNFRTAYGRANVTKATYTGILIYYIYRKVKNSSTRS